MTDLGERWSGRSNLHGDHAKAFYQKPVEAKNLKLVFQLGVGQFSKIFWANGYSGGLLFISGAADKKLWVCDKNTG